MQTTRCKFSITFYLIIFAFASFPAIDLRQNEHAWYICRLLIQVNSLLRIRPNFKMRPIRKNRSLCCVVLFSHCYFFLVQRVNTTFLVEYNESMLYMCASCACVISLIRGDTPAYLLTFQWNFLVSHFSVVLVMSPFSLCPNILNFAAIFTH